MAKKAWDYLSQRSVATVEPKEVAMRSNTHTAEASDLKGFQASASAHPEAHYQEPAPSPTAKAAAPEVWKPWARDTTRPLLLSDVEGHLEQIEKRFEAINDRIAQLEKQKSRA